MTIAFATLNDERVRTLTLTRPAIGCWTADCVLDDLSSTTSGPAVLTLGNITLLGKIFRAGDFTGSASFRLVGGFGGWGKTLPPKFYRVPSGVRLKPILQDAARESGEQVLVQNDRTVGPFYTRPEGPASAVLNSLAPVWFVRDDGVTEVGERSSSVIVSNFDVLQEGTKLNVGRIMVATDSPEDWIPNARFSSPTLALKTISTVVHRLTAQSLRTEVWTSP